MMRISSCSLSFRFCWHNFHVMRKKCFRNIQTHGVSVFHDSLSFGIDVILWKLSQRRWHTLPWLNCWICNGSVCDYSALSCEWKSVSLYRFKRAGRQWPVCVMMLVCQVVFPDRGGSPRSSSLSIVSCKHHFIIVCVWVLWCASGNTACLSEVQNVCMPNVQYMPLLLRCVFATVGKSFCSRLDCVCF